MLEISPEHKKVGEQFVFSYLVLLHELLYCLQRRAVLMRHGHWEALLDPQLQPRQHET